MKTFGPDEPGTLRRFTLGVGLILALLIFTLSGLLPDRLVSVWYLPATLWLAWSCAKYNNLWGLIEESRPPDNAILRLSAALSVAACPACGGRPKRYREVGIFYRKWLCRCAHCNREWGLKV